MTFHTRLRRGPDFGAMLDRMLADPAGYFRDARDRARRATEREMSPLFSVRARFWARADALVHHIDARVNVPDRVLRFVCNSYELTLDPAATRAGLNAEWDDWKANE